MGERGEWEERRRRRGKLSVAPLDLLRIRLTGKSVGFWNYFQHGLDFLVSAEGVVTKIITHSNIVCSIPLLSERVSFAIGATALQANHNF